MYVSSMDAWTPSGAVRIRQSWYRCSSGYTLNRTEIQTPGIMEFPAQLSLLTDCLSEPLAGYNEIHGKRECLAPSFSPHSTNNPSQILIAESQPCPTGIASQTT